METEWLSEEHANHHRFLRAFGILRAAARAKAEQAAPYWRKRGIERVPPCAISLPPNVAKRVLGQGAPGFPTLVFPIVKAGKLIGAQATPLSADGSERVKDHKRSYGPIQGGYVQLGEVDPDSPLIVGEGIESTASAMQITGLPGIATLGTSGMKAVQVPECREVIIAADNDDAGRKAAQALAQRLVNEGRLVRIAWPEYEDEDWNDSLRAGDDVAKMRDAILRAKRVNPSSQVLPLPLKEFMALKFPERQYLLKPWLTSSSLVMVHAQRGHGKTRFALSAARAVAMGEPFLDWQCEQPGRVLYIDGELPGEQLQEEYLAPLGPVPSDQFLVLSYEQLLLRKKLMPDLGTPEGRAALDEIIERQQPDLVILDSLSTLVRTGVENDAESWAPIQHWLMQHRWRGRTMLLLHHEGRSGLPRGTSKREDTLNTTIGLKKRVPKPGEKLDETVSTFDLTFTKTRGFYGKDAAPRVLRMSIVNGRVEWESETAVDDVKSKVAELHKAGWKGKDIAKELNLSEGRVSQIKHEIAEAL